jgi:hypothetical protein
MVGFGIGKESKSDDLWICYVEENVLGVED